MNKYLMTILVVVIAPSHSSANVINVPADQPNIQAGIDAAILGDTVLVADGTYTGFGNRDIDFGGKGVYLKSENGPGLTIIDCEGTSSLPRRGFNFHSVEDTSSVIDGFTIMNGFEENGNGGGIFCDSSSPKIINNTLTSNRGSGGGGVYCNNYSSPIIKDNKVIDNFASHGAGIMCVFNSSPQIIDNTISGNRAGNNGGGIYCSTRSGPVIRNNTIKRNRSFRGGGIYLSRSLPKLSENVISNNHAVGNAGGIYCISEANPTITSCTISGNTTGFSGVGGAIYCSIDSDPIIINTIISFNASVTEAIFCNDATSTPNIFCTNIYGNTNGDWVGCIADQANFNSNFSADPLFCDTAAGDYHLNSASPCIAANSPCGELVGALGVGCEPPTGPVVYLDIKPGSCPNPLNIKGRDAQGKAVIPVALLGTVDFDVRNIDISSLALEGVSPVRHSFDDVSTPSVLTAECACVEGEGDGIEDMTLKFYRSEIVEALGDLHGVSQLKITLTGKLLDGTDFSASDCLKLKPKEGASAHPMHPEGEPEDFTLIGNYPNPFNPTTVISYSLPIKAEVTIAIYNMLGQEVVLFAQGKQSAGQHSVTWDATNGRGKPVASGMYFYKITAGEFSASRKMMLLK